MCILHGQTQQTRDFEPLLDLRPVFYGVTDLIIWASVKCTFNLEANKDKGVVDTITLCNLFTCIDRGNLNYPYQCM